MVIGSSVATLIVGVQAAPKNEIKEHKISRRIFESLLRAIEGILPPNSVND
jgi:hypothetical protein